MSSKNKNLFSGIIEAATKGSEVMSEDFSPRKRPYVRTCFYFTTLIIMFLFLPLLIPIKLFRKKLVDPFAKMRTELETLWHTESNITGLLQLREIYSMLLSNFDMVIAKGIQIEPYGKFGYNEYYKVSHMLYHWELQQDNWDKANDICDDIINNHSVLDPKKSKFLSEWIILKAKILNKLEGNSSAQEFLLKYVDLNDKDSSINTYLYELRKVSKYSRVVI